MALTTYALLKTTIANYLNRTDLTSYLGDFITLTESRMNRELRVREMVNTDTTTTTVAGTQSYSLPSGFLEASAVIYQSNPYRTLRFMANGDFYRQYNVTQTSGLPTFFTIVGENILYVSYTNLRAYETVLDLVCRLLLEKKNIKWLEEVNKPTRVAFKVIGLLMIKSL